jgi:hypothetical protein
VRKQVFQVVTTRGTSILLPLSFIPLLDSPILVLLYSNKIEQFLMLHKKINAHKLICYRTLLLFSYFCKNFENFFFGQNAFLSCSWRFLRYNTLKPSQNKKGLTFDQNPKKHNKHSALLLSEL